MNRKQINLVTALAITLGTAGVSHAQLHPRGGGLIYDDVLDVTWLQDTNVIAGTSYDNAPETESRAGTGNTTDGKVSWFNAMAFAENFSYYDSVRDVYWQNWRLPELKCWNDGVDFNHDRRFDGTSDVGLNITTPCHELSYHYYVNLDNIARKNTSGELQEGSGLVNDPANPNDESLFTGLEPNAFQFFWFSTIRPDNISNAFDMRMDNGNIAFGNWHYDRKVWLVMDGDVATVDSDSGTGPTPDVESNIATGHTTPIRVISIPSIDDFDNGGINISAQLELYGTTPEGHNLWKLQKYAPNNPEINHADTGVIDSGQIQLPSINLNGLDVNQNINITLVIHSGSKEEALWIIQSHEINP